MWQLQLHVAGQVRPDWVRNMKKHLQELPDIMCGSPTSMWQVRLGQKYKNHIFIFLLFFLFFFFLVWSTSLDQTLVMPMDPNRPPPPVKGRRMCLLGDPDHIHLKSYQLVQLDFNRRLRIVHSQCPCFFNSFCKSPWGITQNDLRFTHPGIIPQSV